jgi:hypothetical protein
MQLARTETPMWHRRNQNAVTCVDSTKRIRENGHQGPNAAGLGDFYTGSVETAAIS